MARIEISGIGIEYELVGKPGAQPVAITAGGRFSKDVPGLHEFAEALVAQGKRVLLWDRPNCGASDLCFKGEHESLLHAQTLTGLIRALELGPTVLVGGSAGSRSSLIAAARDPDAVSHLVQLWISGGVISLLALGANYYLNTALAASMHGMEAVAELPAWAEQLERNPKNRDILLSQDPVAFVATLERWAAAFIPSETSPVPGMTAGDFAGLQMPVLIFRSSEIDLMHNARITDQVHAMIPHSQLVDSPWTDEELIAVTEESFATGTGHFKDWPRLTPAIVKFLGQ